jgi:hypothetical protein
VDRQPSPAAARPSVSVWFGKIEIMANRTQGSFPLGRHGPSVQAAAPAHDLGPALTPGVRPTDAADEPPEPWRTR